MALDSDRIQKNIDKLRRIFKNPAQLRTPKRVHDLRTRTRRLEALLPAIHFDAGRNARRLLRELRPIRKRAGKVRDMDVLTSHLLELDINRDTEADCEVQLLEYLGEERHRQGKKLERAVRNRGAEVRARLKRLSRDIRSRTESQRSRGTDNGRQPRVSAAAAALDLADALSEPKTLNRASLHSYRKEVKQLRYVLKAGEGAADKEFINALGACKDAIGEWHDWGELVAIARDVLDHGRACKLIEQLKRIASEKFDAALRTTNQMRNNFVLGRRAAKSANKPFSVKRPGLQAANDLVRRKLAP